MTKTAFTSVIKKAIRLRILIGPSPIPSTSLYSYQCHYRRINITLTPVDKTELFTDPWHLRTMSYIIFWNIDASDLVHLLGYYAFIYYLAKYKYFIYLLCTGRFSSEGCPSFNRGDGGSTKDFDEIITLPTGFKHIYFITISFWIFCLHENLEFSNDLSLMLVCYRKRINITTRNVVLLCCDSLKLSYE